MARRSSLVTGIRGGDGRPLPMPRAAHAALRAGASVPRSLAHLPASLTGPVAGSMQPTNTGTHFAAGRTAARMTVARCPDVRYAPSPHPPNMNRPLQPPARMCSTSRRVADSSGFPDSSRGEIMGGITPWSAVSQDHDGLVFMAPVGFTSHPVGYQLRTITGNLGRIAPPSRMFGHLRPMIAWNFDDPIPHRPASPAEALPLPRNDSKTCPSPGKAVSQCHFLSVPSSAFSKDPDHTVMPPPGLGLHSPERLPGHFRSDLLGQDIDRLEDGRKRCVGNLQGHMTAAEALEAA
jgi:hypothetical protein